MRVQLTAHCPCAMRVFRPVQSAAPTVCGEEAAGNRPKGLLGLCILDGDLPGATQALGTFPLLLLSLLSLSPQVFSEGLLGLLRAESTGESQAGKAAILGERAQLKEEQPQGLSCFRHWKVLRRNQGLRALGMRLLSGAALLGSRT